jgi:hypothetical protein
MQERRARAKRSSLLRKFVTYDCKKFYNIGPRRKKMDACFTELGIDYEWVKAVDGKKVR